MTYSDKLMELIEEFKEVEDKMERLEMVFELSEEVNLLSPEEWSDSTRIIGCQSEAHIRLSIQDSKVSLESGADSKLVQGLMGIMTIAIHGVEAEQALLLTPDFVTEMGILNSLSPSRSNGFRNMFDRVMYDIQENK